jgi:hypothetical protein
MLSLGTRFACVSFAASAALTLALASPTWGVVKNFMSVINAGQEVPPTTTNSFGVGFYTFDTQTKIFCWSISYTDADLSSAENAAHFHGPASPGADGPILIGLPLGSPKQDCQQIDAATEMALKKGQLYVNVHTDNNAGGEIRGQIVPVKGK